MGLNNLTKILNKKKVYKINKKNFIDFLFENFLKYFFHWLKYTLNNKFSTEFDKKPKLNIFKL